VDNRIQDLLSFFENQFLGVFNTLSSLTLAQMEVTFKSQVNEFICKTIALHTEIVSEALRHDKEARRKEGLVLERIGDKRRILTQFGEIEYTRDYYRDRKQQRYRYLMDELLMIERGQRISDELGLDLAETALHVSYAKSSHIKCGGIISRQTVMHKLRNCRPKHQDIGERKAGQGITYRRG
jgi:hypothetical protein